MAIQSLSRSVEAMPRGEKRDSSSRWMRRFERRPAVEPHGLKLEGVVPARDHHQRYRRTIGPGVEVLRLQPCAQPGIVNLRTVLPESWTQPALNVQVIELELNHAHILGKIAKNVGCAHVQPGNSAAIALCFDDHARLLFSIEGS